MIKQLRRRIIMTNMLLIGIVLLVIFAVVNVNSFLSARMELERGLTQVIDRNNKPDDKKFDKPSTDDDPVLEIGNHDFHREPISQLSSYIVLEIDESGNITSLQQNNATMDTDILRECISQITESRKDSGNLSSYNVLYVKREITTKIDTKLTKIAIADNSSVFSALRNTLLISGLLFIGAMGVISLISLGLSSLAVKPVQKSWEQQKQFVADASHELKTPLTVILANNNIMLSQSPDEARRKWLESTGEEAEHMKKLIDQMLFLAKNDAGTAKVELSDINLSEIVEGASLNFEPVAFEKGILIDSEIEPDITVRGDSLRLNQLVHILIDNAVKYGSPDSTVTVRLSRKNDTTELTVNDFGSVISEEELAHIFDRFYRAEKSRTTKGYGLGLSIAREIVRGMNGKIFAESSERGGTTFTVILR